MWSYAWASYNPNSGGANGTNAGVEVIDLYCQVAARRTRVFF